MVAASHEDRTVQRLAAVTYPPTPPLFLLLFTGL
jgi:hypothetical protein